MEAWLRRCFVPAIALLGSIGSTGVKAVTQVVVTIDVESKEEISLPRQISAICEADIPCGLQEILKVLKEYGIAGTFFLNVYEYREWGEDTLRRITRELLSAGQDVALHTHPQWLYDPNRWAMFQYDLAEQTQIVADGCRLLESWTGLPVVAHRAGAYAANATTMEALRRNGIRIDSSLFWGHQWSQLTGLGFARNVPSRWGELTEIPVTVYQRSDRPAVLSGFVPAVTSIRKIDPDWFLNRQEAIGAIDSIVSADLPLLIVFLHSYSFIERTTGTGSLVANRHSIEMFREILEHFNEKKLPRTTMRRLAEAAEMLKQPTDRDIVPEVPVQVGLDRYLWSSLKKLGSISDIRKVFMMMTLAMLIIALSVVWRRRRKSSQ